MYLVKLRPHIIKRKLNDSQSRLLKDHFVGFRARTSSPKPRYSRACIRLRTTRGISTECLGLTEREPAQTRSATSPRWTMALTPTGHLGSRNFSSSPISWTFRRLILPDSATLSRDYFPVLKRGATPLTRYDLLFHRKQNRIKLSASM